MSLPVDFDDWRTRSDWDEEERLGLHDPRAEIARLEAENDRLAAILAEQRRLNVEIIATLKRVIVALSEV